MKTPTQHSTLLEKYIIIVWAHVKLVTNLHCTKSHYAPGNHHASLLKMSFFHVITTCYPPVLMTLHFDYNPSAMSFLECFLGYSKTASAADEPCHNLYVWHKWGTNTQRSGLDWFMPTRYASHHRGRQKYTSFYPSIGMREENVVNH